MNILYDLEQKFLEEYAYVVTKLSAAVENHNGDEQEYYVGFRQGWIDALSLLHEAQLTVRNTYNKDVDPIAISEIDASVVATPAVDYRRR